MVFRTTDPHVSPSSDLNMMPRVTASKSKVPALESDSEPEISSKKTMKAQMKSKKKSKSKANNECQVAHDQAFVTPYNLSLETFQEYQDCQD
eukprot:142750-Amorphochlora_amoeboformis.AAC.2